jgi:hypothetical protein
MSEKKYRLLEDPSQTVQSKKGFIDDRIIHLFDQLCSTEALTKETIQLGKITAIAFWKMKDLLSGPKKDVANTGPTQTGEYLHLFASSDSLIFSIESVLHEYHHILTLEKRIPRMNSNFTAMTKVQLLQGLFDLERCGIFPTRRFTIQDDIEEIEFELEFMMQKKETCIRKRKQEILEKLCDDLLKAIVKNSQIYAEEFKSTPENS